MAVRRSRALVATIVLAVIGVVAVADPSAADEVLTPSATSVAVGSSFMVDVSGCDLDVEESGVIRIQYPKVVLVTGVGGTERAVTLSADAFERTLTIPGWVDPAESAELRGVCVETRYRFEDGHQEEIELFSYPPVAIDVLPADPGEVRQTTLVLDRDTVAGGQLLLASVGGCRPGEYVGVTVLADTDLSLRGLARSVASESVPAQEGPATTVELPLHDTDSHPGGPLADGDYVVVGVCYSYDGPTFAMWNAEPTWLHVSGTAMSGAMSIVEGDARGELVINGDGCMGLPPTVRVSGYEYGLIDDEGDIDDTLVPTQDVDGAWSATWTTTAIGYWITVTADCGDPTVDGFRYPTVSWYQDGYSGQWVGRISPTTSPVGGSIDVHVEGSCDAHHSMVQILSGDGEVLSEGMVMSGGLAMGGRATVTAPAAAGTYSVVAMCDGRPSMPGSIQVFAPTPVAPRAPLPPGPVAGWPETGEREEFHGRLGPITLPAGSHHGVGGGDASAAGLGPSALGISIPRPAGDFAITEMTFDLVDEHGNSVSTSDAHLHHLVIANLNSSNPACPTGTFGLPGEIIAAAGAERTALDFGDPYGLVVEEADAWAGVYELMSMADEEQTVYLTYDMEIRRDVENVRPVTTYFGSATGCGSFTWTIDGSGTPDRQGHYLTVANDGVLVGAGGHIHNGGLYTDLYDDRGRRLCRNELVLGEPDDHEHPVTTTTPDHGSTTTTTMHDHSSSTVTTEHHHGAMVSRSAPAGTLADDEHEVTATTVDEWESYPPEMYPDDPPLEAITTCRPHEQLRAGERLYFEATYANDRARSGVMGIFMIYVWEGSGPPTPYVPGTRPPVLPPGPTVPGGGGSTTSHPHHPDPEAPGSTEPEHPTDPTHPVDPTDPSSPGSPGAPASPAGPGGSPGTGSPGGVSAGSATPARPASAARPYRGNASYTG